jgi:hypothetical protein
MRALNLLVVLTMLFVVAIAAPVSAKFEHAIVFDVDGEDYYMAGAPDGPGGAIDIPGHYWVQAGSGQVEGKHLNTGPGGAPQWWSSDAPDGELLYKVHGIIDEWTMPGTESTERTPEQDVVRHGSERSRGLQS